MDDVRFDRWTRGLDARISRRGLSGMVAGALAVVGLATDADAKKKKKKKKKKPAKINYSCGNLGTPCGNTAVCQCRMTKSNQQICANGVNPPNGLFFLPCQTSANCPSGQICDLLNSICATACRN